MKKKKISSLILCAAVLLTNMFVLNLTVSATDPEVPALPKNAIVSTVTNGVFGVTGSYTSSMRTITTVLSSATDFSKADNIEFDLYVQSATRFWNYQAAYLTSPNHTFCFYLSPSNAEPPSVTTTNQNFIQTADNHQIFLQFPDPENTLRDQITEDGWNHIKVPLTEWKTGNGSGNYGTPVMDLSYFSGIQRIGFYSGRYTNNASGGDQNLGLGFANVCGTLDVPEAPSNAIVSTVTDGVFGVYGTTSGEIRNVTTVLDSPVDFSEADYLEFDLYIENIGSFENIRDNTQYLYGATGNHTFCFYLSPSDDALPGLSNNNARDYIQTPANHQVFLHFVDETIKNQITASGWNHIKIPLTDWKTGNGKGTDAEPKFGTPIPDLSYFSSIQRIGWFSGRNVNLAAGHQKQTIGFANVCGTSKADFKSRSLVLTDQIGVNFFMDLSDLTAEEKANSYMTFAVTHYNKTLRDNFDSENVNDAGYYRFTCLLTSVEMAETIVPTFHFGDGKTLTGNPFSVKEYIDYVVEHSDSYPDGLVILVRALGDYGHYAQIYLGNKNRWTAGEKYTVMPKYRASDYTTDHYSAYLGNLSEEAMEKDITGSAVTRVSYNLNFGTNTYININLTSGESLTASAMVAGERIEASEGGTFRTQGLMITKLGDRFTLTGKGSSNTTPFSVTLSGLSYIRSILNKETESVEGAKNAVASLYDYYNAAKSYVTYNESLDGEYVSE